MDENFLLDRMLDVLSRKIKNNATNTTRGAHISLSNDLYILTDKDEYLSKCQKLLKDESFLIKKVKVDSNDSIYVEVTNDFIDIFLKENENEKNN